MKEDKDTRLHNSNFIDACNNALNGIIYATTTQSNIKKQLIIAVVVMIVSLFCKLESTEFLCLMFSVVLIIFAEMVNTAIETLVDLYTDVYHPKAKIAKDVAAGAVVITALNAVILAYFLFFEKIGRVGTTVLESVLNSPMHIVFVGIILIVIALVAIKANATSGKTKFLKPNFIPSGQSALAFAALTAIWINSKDIIVFTLALGLSLLVVENRIENNARKLSEVLFGICMGVLIIILVYGLTFLNI